jgi:DNA-binding NtrC family response regulator/ligand-binding sensor domain-containing protein
MSANLKTINYGLIVSLKKLLIRVFVFAIPFYLCFWEISYCQQRASFPSPVRTLKFENISIEQGLSQSTVLCILQDSRGFMWFGTEDGLNKYDGYKFTIYRTALDDPNSLSHNYVYSIYEAPDEPGTLWIGTIGGGLNKFDRNKEQFTRYQADANNSFSLSNNEVKSIYGDKGGSLWIGTFGGGLNRLIPSPGSGQASSENEESPPTFTVYRHQDNNPTSLSSDQVNVVFKDNSGVLWIGTQGGGLNKLILNDAFSRSPGQDPSKLEVERIDPEIQQFIRYLYNPDDPTSLSDDIVNSLYEDSHGNLWIGTNGGLDMFDREKDEFIHFKADPNDPNSLNDNSILAICESPVSWSGRRLLWIATAAGVDIFDREKEKFIHCEYKPDDPSSLSNNWVFSLYEDRSGLLWIGTNGGLSQFDPRKDKFIHYHHDPDKSNSLSHNYVRAFCESSTDSGLFWIGTDGGLDLFDREQERFIHYHAKPQDAHSLSHDWIREIYEDSSGILWIGTYGGGLNKLILPMRRDGVGVSIDAKSSDLTFTHYRHDPENPNSLSDDLVLSVYQDRSGTLWIGTETGGLNELVQSDSGNENEGSHATFIHHQHDPNNPNSLSHNFVKSIFEDSKGMLWIGTIGRGLNRLVTPAPSSISGDNNESSPTFIRYQHDPENPNSLSSNDILAICETRYDGNGFLWIGTGGGGLNKFDLANETFTHYREKDGLPNETIYGILEDNQGFLWLSTNKGLSKFDPETETFRNYDMDDGLQSNEFNGGAYYGSKSGQMYFGGVNGFNVFNPEDIKDNPYIPPVVITDFQIFNESVGISGNTPLRKHITETEEITLSYKDNVFSFEFAALSYANPEKNRFKYIMDGFDEDWIDSGTRRFVTYTNLDPGQYIFRVTGTNNDGIWSEEGVSLRIIITPPFWQTWWLRTLVILSVLLLAYTLYKRRVSKLETKKRQLEERIKERTEAANKLQNALDQVRHLKDQLQAENVYLQDEIKIAHNFEYIISRSEALKKVLSNVEQVASTDATVLILGESGTGKELVARAIHNISNRTNRPLVKVNCSALPENLIESELFGHEKGAFTGAISQKIGRFELANEGTIFLDEIGDLPFELQTKLLRVLQEGEFERIGNPKTIKVDVRVIAATNRNLEEAIKNGKFREDLYYRLNVFPIMIPPLRERKEDIPLLVKHFMEKYSAKAGKQVEMVSQNLIDKLQAYSWPGNVRELENIIERAVIITPGKKLILGDWLPISEAQSEDSDILTLEEIEKKHILRALEKTGWRVSGEKGAAKILGLKSTTLEARMKKLDIGRNH